MDGLPDSVHGGRRELDAVLALEQRLADPAVRADPVELRRLLHPEFEEVGRTGRHWHRDAIIDVLAQDPGDGFALFEPVAQFLAPGIVLLTYAVCAEDAEHPASRHSSIWVHDHGHWQVRYHQGTLVA